MEQQNPIILYLNTAKTIEEQQSIPELNITENGELLTYNLNNMRITKHINNNMYTLESIIELLHNVSYKTVTSFLNSSRFQYILNSYDENYRIEQFVYYIRFDNYIKIGRTFNIKKRYQPKDINKRVYRLVFVKNVDKCERELIKNFSKQYNIYKGREGFEIKSQQDITESLELFDKTTDKYSKNITNDMSNHLQHYIRDKIFGTGYYISPLVASIILNIFSDTEYKDCKQFFNTIETISNKFDKSDYISSFTEGKDNFFYWKFHGYTVIVNTDRNLINASRLWNTIIKTQNKKTEANTFKRFLQLPRIKNMIKEDNELKPINMKFKKRPLLNGRYMPVIFVHFIVYYLDAKYAFKVAKIMTESLFEKAKKEAIKNKGTTDSKTISGGYITETNKMNTINNLLKALTNTNIGM